MQVAIGARHHTGWAVLVTVAGSPSEPVVIDRRRVEVIDPSLPRQVYHAVENEPLPEAERLVAEVTAAAATGTARQTDRMAADAADAGHEVVAAGIVGQHRRLPELERILASHTLLHSAEGELYRAALEAAFAARGIPVVCQAPREVAATARDLATTLAAVGRQLGPPWQKDHKEATVAALVALTAGGRAG